MSLHRPATALSVSAFSGVTDTHPKPMVTTWPQLINHLREPRVCEVKNQVGAISPTIFAANTKRSRVNAQWLTMLVLDVDNSVAKPDPTATAGQRKGVLPRPLMMEEVASLLRARGTQGFLASTWSHTEAWPHFRVFIPLSEPVPASRWEAAVDWALKDLGLETHWAALDLAATKDVARLYYLPCTKPGSEPAFIEVEGDSLSIPMGTLPPPPKRPVARATEPLWDGFEGDLRTLDLVGVLQALGCKIGPPVKGKEDVHKCQCPFEAEHSNAGGLDAWFWQVASGVPKFGCFHDSCQNRGLKDVLALAGASVVAEHCTRQIAERPTIRVTTDEPKVVDEAIKALSGLNQVYVRAGGLVHVPFEMDPEKLASRGEAPIILPIPDPRLEELLSEAARWERTSFTAAGEPRREEIRPPKWVVQAIQARGAWPMLPGLRGVTETPVLRADLSLLQAEGYDAESQLLYLPRQDFPLVPEKPTKAEAVEAMAQLKDLVVDFPFDGECHQAAYLAALLTPFARLALDEPVPFFLADANTRGTGKTLLMETIAYVATGRTFPRMTHSAREEEEEKRILGVAQDGTPLVLVDNITGTFGSGPFAAVLTANTFKGRVLGRTGNPEFPLVTTWFGTGNNVVLIADLNRRTVPIRLKSPLERPEERGGFAHPHLVDHIKANRGQLVAAALTVLRAFIAAGRPCHGLKPFGSYEGWSKLVRGAVSWVCNVDPCEARSELASAGDYESEYLRVLVEGWKMAFPGGGPHLAAEFLMAVKLAPSKFVGAVEAMEVLCRGPKRDDLPSTVQVGKMLAQYKERVIAGAQFVQAPGSDKSGRRWMLMQCQGGEPLPRPVSEAAITANTTTCNPVEFGVRMKDCWIKDREEEAEASDAACAEWEEEKAEMRRLAGMKGVERVVLTEQTEPSSDWDGGEQSPEPPSSPSPIEESGTLTEDDLRRIMGPRFRILGDLDEGEDSMIRRLRPLPEFCDEEVIDF